MKRKIGYIALAALIIMQFFQIEKKNPEIDLSQDFLSINKAPEGIARLFKSACYDCHSHETTYPWYTSIAPLSFWIKGHINGGRNHLNFSTWGTYTSKKMDHKIEECIEKIGEKKMPLLSYIIAHSEARLSDSDRKNMVSWLKEL
jgi:hypothetical protein